MRDGERLRRGEQYTCTSARVCLSAFPRSSPPRAGRTHSPWPLAPVRGQKNSWHGLRRAPIQEWTDMNCTVISANNFSALSWIVSRISPVQSAVSVRKSTLYRPFIFPILNACFQRQTSQGSQLLSLNARTLNRSSSKSTLHKIKHICGGTRHNAPVI